MIMSCSDAFFLIFPFLNIIKKSVHIYHLKISFFLRVKKKWLNIKFHHTDRRDIDDDDDDESFSKICSKVVSKIRKHVVQKDDNDDDDEKDDDANEWCHDWINTGRSCNCDCSSTRKR